MEDRATVTCMSYCITLHPTSERTASQRREVSQGGHETSYVRGSAPTSAEGKPPRKAQEDDGSHWCEGGERHAQRGAAASVGSAAAGGRLRRSSLAVETTVDNALPARRPALSHR